MAYYIQINGLGPQPYEMPINEDSLTVGSSPSCTCRVEHAEVEARALQLDVRGDDFWIQNCNPYPIYVGENEVVTDSWAPWGIDESIQLTRTISLNVVEREDVVTSADTADEGGDEKKKSSGGAGKIAQISAILICLILVPLFLLGGGDREGRGSEKTAKFNFNDVITQLDTRNSEAEYRILKRYLQQAWIADRRWTDSNPAVVAKYYQLVSNHRLIRNNQLLAEDARDDTLSDIHTLAEARLDELGK